MSCNVNRKMYTCGAGILESICIDIDTETYIHTTNFPSMWYGNINVYKGHVIMKC